MMAVTVRAYGGPELLQLGPAAALHHLDMFVLDIAAQAAGR